MKKLPKAFTSAMLLELLNSNGFSGAYDFVYLPVDFDKMMGTGCAFVNFTSNDTAEQFMTRFQGFSDWGVRCGGAKKAEISWSQACQGRLAHVERYRDSPVMHPSVPDTCKPMLFKEGQEEPFPEPVRMPKPPRMGRSAPESSA